MRRLIYFRKRAILGSKYAEMLQYGDINQNVSCQMVCLPQVSKAFFNSRRLDVVMEEKFTILKEDLADNAAFFNKLDQALREVTNWNRDPFDERTMLEVRNLFETDINLDESVASDIKQELASSYHKHDYSRFYYFCDSDIISKKTSQILSTNICWVANCTVYSLKALRWRLLLMQ